MAIRLISSGSAAARRAAAAAFLSSRGAAEEALIVGASRGAADDLARHLARQAGATFGLTRFSLTELASRAAVSRLAARVPGGDPEAVAARAVFDATAANELDYFAPVSAMPGFARALARTIHELRLAGVDGGRLMDGGPATADIGRLLARVEDQLARASALDRAGLFRLAAEACAGFRWAGLKTVFLDVPLESRAERAFAAAILSRAPEALATVPDGDERARAALLEMGAIPGDAPAPLDTESDLSHLRRYVFTSERPPQRSRAGDVVLFSAPGEGREAVEIVRRILDEAQRGVPFDEMAVLLRAPQHYLGLLEHACARGGVPVYFDRGTSRPDPAGRAFVALLSCAVEGLSARRFDEYLSLGQVPPIESMPDAGASARRVVRSRDEAVESLTALAADDQGTTADTAVPEAHPDDADPDGAVVAGTLRSPWKWEELIVESAVIGGRTRGEGRDRWRRRLNGLEADYRFRLDEIRREEPESPRIPRFERELANLRHLRRFALPIIDALAEWPVASVWGEWLERFGVLAGRVLKRPARVLDTLAGLRPMADVGPVTLEEARDVLHDRLVALDWDPPARRYGRVFVGTPHQARGRTFRVVFVPGLAERVVPQRPREDPLLLDELRGQLDAALTRQADRAAAERLLLKVAIGAAGERLYLSYPRLEVGAEMRARVPSFYALDVMRAITGTVPDHRVLATRAADEAGASLAWPAPADPDRAIDDLEHDLAMLRPLLDSRDPASVRGHAHYLLGLNDALRRSVVGRWARGRAAWSDSDGLVRVTPGIAASIAANRLRARKYSLSALQRYATCPYQFLLSTIHRLEPWEDPEPIVRLDPLTRGSLFHAVQAEFSRTLQSEGRLPVTHDTVPAALTTLGGVLRRVAGEYEEKLAPAIERVWRDEIEELGRDLGIWVTKLADTAEWVGEYFEFSFGLNDDGRDPRSLKDPILVDGRFLLHGSVDLIERHAGTGALRVTDHKTGRNRSNDQLIVDGGKVLQPVLYSVAVAHGLGQPVASGRLYYCTTAGGFGERDIPIDDYARRQGLEVLTIVDRAVEQGFLAAAPSERACTWCDFRAACGPREEERVAHKAKDRLADLAALRSMR
jgi:CRISPR/Cas system-associated exonuclease Cas4 (RecB family)